jgi:hypothetical protein
MARFWNRRDGTTSGVIQQDSQYMGLSPYLKMITDKILAMQNK